MTKHRSGTIQMIPVERVDVLNPRERNDKVFGEIVGNIKTIGLKKPITVTPRKGPDDEERYLLVCGEGRLKAFKSLGEAEMPALVIEASDEDAFIMSLAENIARRQYRPLELLAGIEALRDKGCDKRVIAAKTGLTVEYVQGILTLLRHGEERLLVAVQKGRIPLNAALAIVGAGDDDKAVQVALQDQLEQELGLDGEGDLPELDELVRRLASVRSEWDWKEPCDPGALASEPPLSSADAEGLYNRAVFVVAERSPYTQGLEAELKSLTQLAESAYANTALGQWLSNSVPNRGAAPEQHLVEVMPLNTEQRQAVRQALSSPLTIITGPPGTGKSQVVADILINAAWQGQRVLFASKNNKAVDVVEIRINNIGPRPILLRVGSNQYQTKLAEYLLALLSATATEEEQRSFNEIVEKQKQLEQEDSTLSREEEAVVALRNCADTVERSVEAIRAELTPGLFAAARSLDLDKITGAAANLDRRVREATKEEQPFPIRLLWPMFRSKRFHALQRTAEATAETISSLRASLLASAPDDASMSDWRVTVDQILQKLDKLRQAKAYFETLATLQQTKPLEAIAREKSVLLTAMSANAEQLWTAWLRLQPARLSRPDRQLLQKYNALLKMVIETGADGKLAPQAFREYNNLFPKVAHLLPCWAVTSLSARGKIPFEAGFFDLVVFDEASQCDIASALPLLYRAKRAAIIGDPKQLSHISSLLRGQDQQMLEKHGLIGEFPQWAYSYNSLFDLASGCASSEHIVSLRDHHRSHADVIDFSNEFFYEGRLRVATRYELLRRPNSETAGVRWVDVQGRAIRPPTGGAFNREEGRAVVEELRRLVVERGYQGSIGVVSPFRAQANLIREMVVRDAALAEPLAKREFLADTVHKFQGDERDLMVFSPVVSQGITGGALGFLRNNGNLFNVAITRARAMLLVVGDLSAASNCEVEYLRKFAQYTQKLRSKDTAIQTVPPDGAGPEYPKVANPEQVSDWEKLFYRALYEAGIRTIPQFQIEKYTLDFALVVDAQRRLNIEVDGERYHKAWNGELCRRDQMRNQRLFELGWDVMRFWVYEVRDDLGGCVRRVADWRQRQIVTSPVATN